MKIDILNWLHTHPDRAMDTTIVAYRAEQDVELVRPVVLQKIRPAEYAMFYNLHTNTTIVVSSTLGMMENINNYNDLCAFLGEKSIHRVICLDLEAATAFCPTWWP
jgi:hypothetical protein